MFGEFQLSQFKAGTVVKAYYDREAGKFVYGHVKRFVTLANDELAILVTTQTESEIIFRLDDIEIL
jgi:hypothetical protein